MHTGSIDGATSLLIDELISVRDDNYFPCAVEPVTNNNNTNSSSNRSASSASGGAAVNTSSGGNGVNNNGNGDRQASDSSRINNSTEEVRILWSHLLCLTYYVTIAAP